MVLGARMLNVFYIFLLINKYPITTNLGGIMKRFTQLIFTMVLVLVLGMSTLNAQEVVFVPGPTISVATSGGVSGANGGFGWGDLNGDGILDVFIPSNIVFFNAITSFAPAASTATVNIPINNNSTGALLADFNGDGIPDLFTTNGGTPSAGLLYNNAGVFTAATGTGDLASAGVTGEVFQGASAAPIDHSNYLSLCFPGTFTGIASNNPAPAGGGIWLLKGGPTGFTNIGRLATTANRGIDTTLSFESWDVRFFDANNDGYMDLLMPNFRNGFSKIDTGSSAARKGCVQFLNDGTGKFIIPTAATLGRTIYSIGAGNVASTVGDTGIIVNDTVRHFAAIGEQWGDLNNDGIEDLILNGLNATDNLDGNGTYQADVILYGNGDGTFTYKWDGVHVVANNGLVQNTAQRSISIGDYNNDGWADIFTAHTFGPQHLYRNNGDGTFTDEATADNLTTGGARAAQLVDYDNDGFLDIFMYTGGAASLQKNGRNSNKWIGFNPIGTGNNMSAIGAKFTVWAGGKKQIRVISAEGGSSGMGGTLRANFGLGTAAAIDSVSALWPDGVLQKWPGAAFTINSYVSIIEGSVYLAAPTTSRPSYAAGDTSVASSNTFKWNKVSGGTVGVKYLVQIGTSKAMTSLLQSFTALTDTFKVAKVPLASKIFWRVAGLSGNITGAFSAVDSFQTNKTPATTVPKQLSPTSNQLHLPKQPTLVSSSTPEAYIYHFQLDTVNRFAARDTLTGAARFTGLVFNDSTTVTDTTKLMNALTPNRKYFWRVRGWNAAGASAYSSVDSFTIQYLPLATTLVYPTHNQADARADTLVFRVQKVDADSFYVFQTWTFTSAGQAFRSDTTKQSPTLTLTGLSNRARYFWKVQVGNQAGWSAFTAVDSFTTVIELASAPNAVTPKNTTAEQRRTKFVWSKATNAVWYHLQVATTNFNSPSDIVEDVTIQTDTTYTIKDTLKAATLYYWHVSGVNLGGEGVFSGSAHFTTGTTVGVVEAINEVPQAFTLMQNYPNPFNPSTTISYDLPKTSVVKLYIYDVLGRVVANLVDGVQTANRYRVEWNPSRLSSGVYFYRIQARSQDGSADFTSVKKLLYMK
jgi:hypothetical protein